MASFKGGENSTDPRRCMAHSSQTGKRCKNASITLTWSTRLSMLSSERSRFSATWPTRIITYEQLNRPSSQLLDRSRCTLKLSSRSAYEDCVVACHPLGVQNELKLWMTRKYPVSLWTGNISIFKNESSGRTRSILSVYSPRTISQIARLARFISMEILSIDGGGYLRLATAAFLDGIESHFKQTLHNQFADLRDLARQK